MPKHLWRKLRTTNVIERCFVEVRRRTRQMVCFVNEPGSSGRTLFWTMLQCSMNFRLRPSLKPLACIPDPCVSPSCALGNPHLQSDFSPAPLISFRTFPRSLAPRKRGPLFFSPTCALFRKNRGWGTPSQLSFFSTSYGYSRNVFALQVCFPRFASKYGD